VKSGLEVVTAGQCFSETDNIYYNTCHKLNSAEKVVKIGFAVQVTKMVDEHQRRCTERNGFIEVYSCYY